MKNKEIFLFSDQPTTCPQCGSRTGILEDTPNSPEHTQIHICLSVVCIYEIVMEVDVEL